MGESCDFEQESQSDFVMFWEVMFKVQELTHMFFPSLTVAYLCGLAEG
jgi:hypothetical protein